MAICEHCEGIDPETFWNDQICHRTDYELQRYDLMIISAQDGCSGCRFFLEVLRQDVRNAKVVNDALQCEEPVSISSLHVWSLKIGNISVDSRFRLCLVQGSVSLSPKVGILRHAHPWSGADSTRSPIGDRDLYSTGPWAISVDPSSEMCMNMSKRWLEKCGSHENCPPQATVRLPTHLIEVSQESGECRLHISDPGEHGHYVTLSHCWGRGIINVLKKANIKQLQATMRTESLPRNFQDAVVITRRLGLRFLWIDALCIIQDSVEDWACESSRMADVYQNGTLMISAVAAPDSQYGILRPRDILQSHRFGRHKQFVFQTWDSPDGTMDILGPLHRRGWCLQERIMAPRILHFGEQKLVWECCSKVWTEDSGFADVKSDGLRVIDSRASAMPFIWRREADFEEEDHRVERLMAFYQCIEDFTGRKLTKRFDKLPAFSGLASAFHTSVLGVYVAGLWENGLVRGLNWYRWTSEFEEDRPQPQEYIAPSWSWASMRSGCKYHRTWPDTAALWPEWAKESEHFHRTLSPRLLSYHTELATSDPYGRISDASIKLRGYTRSVLVWPDQPRSSGLPGVFLDRQHGQNRSDMDCVWMFEHPHEPPHWEYLERVPRHLRLN